MYIPKADGSRRPLGIPALEDKIVQGAVAEVLSAIYEVDFLGFSYGFRPGRGPHDALRSLHKAIMTRYVNWVLDADLRRFFDSVDHEWLIRMVRRRIADPRVLTLIQGWLTAGVMEGKEWNETREGTPQGAGISPLLANVFLHYVLDLWVHQWRGREARGRVCVVRYADDFVLGFQYESDARRMMAALRERMGKLGQTLHAEKTRLIEFGRLRAIRPSRIRQASVRDDRLSGLHPLLWVDSGRAFHPETQDAKEKTNGQPDATAWAGEAADAQPGCRTVPVALSRTARALRLLWRPVQLSFVAEFLSGDLSDMVSCVTTSKPMWHDVGAFQPDSSE